MRKNILVSVAMITYNQEQYIEQALNSVLQQNTDFPIEVIVGDDCSRDTTPQILRRYHKMYPDKLRVVLRKKNLGVTANFYDVLMQCEGSYIALLEGDDYWNDNNKLQKQVEFLECHSEYSATAHDYLMLDKQGNEFDHGRKVGKYTLSDYCKGRLPGQTGTLCFRNFLKNKESDFSIIYKASREIGDRTLVLLLLLIAPIYCSKEIMSVYRIQSSTHSWSGAAADDVTLDSLVKERRYITKLINYTKESTGITVKPIWWEAHLIYRGIKRERKYSGKENKKQLQILLSKYSGNKLMLLLQLMYFNIKYKMKKTPEN